MNDALDLLRGVWVMICLTIPVMTHVHGKLF